MMRIKERRSATDHDVILTVVHFVGGSIWLLSAAVSISLTFNVAYCVIFNKPMNTNVLPLLIAAVTNPLSAALGYVAGLLTNSKRDVPPGTPESPMNVATPPGQPLTVKEQDVKPDVTNTAAGDD